MAILRPAGDFDQSYVQDMSIMRRPWQVYFSWTVVGLVLLLPFIGIAAENGVFGADFRMPASYTLWMSRFNRIAYSIIAVQGLHILTGMTGQISLGQAAFMLVGGYISGLLMIHLGLPIVFTIPLAAIGTGLIGLIFGLPSLRVKGFYLAMATLAAQFIIPWASRTFWPEYLGGSNGAIALPIPTLFGMEFNGSVRFFIISYVTLIVTSIIVNNIKR
ncbi:MAG: branched-chain amino acid ABC transporter permease, partial [Chloroflexota bacterium]